MSNIYSKKNRSCDKIESRDEYITPYWAVEILLDGIKEELQKSIGGVLCPCDAEDSAFVQYCKNNNIKVIYSCSDFVNLDPELIEQVEWVITNPPFSSKQMFYNKFKDKKCIFLGQVLFMLNKFLGDLINQGIIKHVLCYSGTGLRIQKWKNGAKEVMGIVAWGNIEDKYIQQIREYYKKRLEATPNWENIKKSKTKEEIKQWKNKAKEKADRDLKTLSEKLAKDGHYRDRHLIYCNRKIWGLYKMMQKRVGSIQDIIARVLKNNNW